MISLAIAVIIMLLFSFYAIRLLKEVWQAERQIKRTVKSLRSAMSGTVQAMANVVESKDPYTAGHQRRVADLARSIAKELGLPMEKIDCIRLAGLIHDIGKVAVPAEILSKPGTLTDIEMELVKHHAQVGYDILKDIEFPCPIAQIVAQHHEKIDGSGYPAGLSGDDILPEAKILAVADSVEAICSHRPYRPALGIEKALEIISEGKGTLYDADVVDACTRLFKEQEYAFDSTHSKP
jgi:putative nucleotidyltransferase with HDIG domain